MNTMVWNEEGIRDGKSCISKIEAASGDCKISGPGIAEYLSICSTTFPSRECVDKAEVEPTGCKKVLTELTLSVTITRGEAIRHMGINMRAINGTETSIKVWEKLWIVTNLLRGL